MVERLAKDYGFGSNWSLQLTQRLTESPDDARTELLRIVRNEEEAKNAAQPEPDSYDITYLALFDVSGHPGHGGHQLFLWESGMCIVRHVQYRESMAGFVMSIYEDSRTPEQMSELKQLLAAKGLFTAISVERMMAPGEVSADVFVELQDGRHVRKSLYVDDQHPALAPIYRLLLKWATAIASGEPEREELFSPKTPLPAGFNPKGLD